MPAITRPVSIDSITDPLMQQVTRRCTRIALLSAQKATGHLLDPDLYPIERDSDDFAFERVFLKYLETRRMDRRRLADRIDKSQFLFADADIGQIDLKSRKSVAAQATPLHRSTNLDELERRLSHTTPSVDYQPTPISARPPPIGPVRHGINAPLRPPISPQPSPLPLLSTLDFYIESVTCNEETTEIGRDQIHLGGTRVDCDASVSRIPTFKLGLFETGDKKDKDHHKFGGTFKTITSFDPTKMDDSFPKTFIVTLVLAEKDMGGMSGFLEDLVEQILELILRVLGDVVGTVLTAASISVAIVAAIGVAIAIAIGFLVDFLIDWWKDEIFPPFSQELTLQSYANVWNTSDGRSPTGIARFDDHGGLYTIEYSWRLH